MKRLKKIIPLLIISSLSHAAYEDHFPVYYEYCTGTQWKPREGKPGGIPGHAFTYIHGLCKDYRASYPKVIPCSQVSKKMRAAHPHEGVGISLDKNFLNVKWVAVPGRDMMLFGDKKPKPMSKEDAKRQIQKVTDLKVFQGVTSKSVDEKNVKRNTPAYLKTIAEDTLGTDHAANWARDLHCVKVPAPKESLLAVANFLNDSNSEHRSGKDYNWDMYSNNCVHLSLNTSAAIGLNDQILTDQKFLKKLTNMALPANGFLMMSDKAVLAREPSIRKLKGAITENGVNPAQVGSVMTVYHAFPSGEVFNTEDLKVLTGPRLTKPFKLLTTPQKYEKKYMTPENTNLKANAQMWLKRYEELLADLKPKDRGTEIEKYLLHQIALSKKIIKAEK
jgi:hypothetical protein